MNQDKNIQELIEGYLQQSLEPEELKAFGERLATDKTLQEEVEIAKLAQLAAIRNKFYQVESILTDIRKQEKHSQKRKVLLLGSGLALLLAGGIYFGTPKQSNVESITVVGPAAEKVIEKAIANEPVLKTDSAGITQPKPVKASDKIVKKDTLVPVKTSETRPQEQAITKDTSKKVIIRETQVSRPLPSVTEPKLPEDPCASVKLEASVFTESACRNEQNGRISLSGFKGGKAPYVFHVYNEANVSSTATHLAKGVYSVLLEDGLKCTRKWHGIVINEKDCKKDFEFNPAMGEIVELEDAPVSATLSIYGKDGIVYFYKTFGAGEKIQWNGASNSGEIMSGYFVFQIHYQDGKMRKGTVTATR